MRFTKQLAACPLSSPPFMGVINMEGGLGLPDFEI